MREIKFRAWDKKRGHFHWGISNVCLTLGGNFMWQFGYNAPDFLSKEESEQFILQQYTGLKDKNGKEIYEGDIINRPYQDGSYDRKVVKSCDGGWNPFIDDMTTDKSFRYEIIGNIYENPSLIGE